MRFGQALKWLTGQEKNTGTEAGQGNPRPQRDGIVPVLYEYRDLNSQTPDTDQEERDNSTLDKMENYYYKEADQQQIVKFIFEKVPKKLEELHVEYFEERIEALEDLIKAMNNKLMRKTALNYDKFCVGIQTVVDIKQIILTQSDQFSVVKHKHQLLKEFYAFKIQELNRKRKRAEKKNEFLGLLSFIQEKIMFLLKAYKPVLQLDKQPVELAQVQALLRDLLQQLKTYFSIEKNLDQSFQEKNPKLLPLLKRLKEIAQKGRQR